MSGRKKGRGIRTKDITDIQSALHFTFLSLLSQIVAYCQVGVSCMHLAHCLEAAHGTAALYHRMMSRFLLQMLLSLKCM